MSKTRSDSTIAQLTADQRDQLFDWLGRHSYSEVIALAAKPIDDGGLNIAFHRNTLVRFHDSETAERRRERLAEAAAASSAESDLPADFKQHMIAAKARYGEATYNLAKAADDPENYDRLQRAVHHFDQCALKCRELDQEQQRIELARQRLAEDIRQFEFCAAREVMKAYVAYQEIDQRTDIDEIDKIWEARKVAYGPRADETPKPHRVALADSQEVGRRSPLRAAVDPIQQIPEPTAETSAQIHAAPENPLGPPDSRLASAPEIANSEQLSAPCPPKPCPKEDLSSKASAKADLSSVASAKADLSSVASAKEKALSPAPAPLPLPLGEGRGEGVPRSLPAESADTFWPNGVKLWPH